MSDRVALDGFLDKWRQRWPEWRVLETFVPASQRATALAWFALQQEFADAMNIAGDPLPADAKLAWWGEELRDWTRHRSRHPLGRVLEPTAAPWFELAESLPVLVRLREPQASLASAIDVARPLAKAVVDVDAALFQAQADAPQVQAATAHWLASRAAALGEDNVVTAGLDWPSQLLDAWPTRPGGAIASRLWSAMARSRWQRSGGADVAPLSPIRALWLGWRAARR